MKLHNTVILLLISYLIYISKDVCAEDTQIESHQIKAIEESSDFELIQTFRTPKRILFSCLFGGSSHNHWVISILDELNQRGHSTAYMTKTDQVKFTNNYPNIDTFSIGKPTTHDMENVWGKFRTETSLDDKAWSIINIATVETMKEDARRLTRMLEKEKFDLVICDLFNHPCMLAAHKHNLPTIVTSSQPVTNDVSTPYINTESVLTNAPTTQYMTLWERVRDKVLKQIALAWKLRTYLSDQIEMLKFLEIDDLTVNPEDRYKNYVKLYNTAFGIQQGRPLGPLVEFIGPILKAKVPKLDSELASFLDSHKRVAYIAFGQLTTMTEKDTTLVLTGLIEAYENNEIDGIIWATRGRDSNFPELIVSQSKATYNISSILTDPSSANKDFVFLSWAPQMAILNHPSILFFVTHGGSASLYESLYSGTRMVIYPFFVDQPFAAVTGEKNGYALKLDPTSSQTEATDIIRRVARDQDNALQNNTDRFKALVQIRSKHGITRGADIVEEVLFLHENGKVTHRKDVKDDLSFVKANNLDVYAVLLLAFGSIVYGIGRFVGLLFGVLRNMFKKQTKAKTL